MLEKWNERCRKLFKAHFWCTVCGVLLFGPGYMASMACFTVGANSLYIALCYGGFDESIPLATFGALWFVTYPFAYLVSYILAKWKRIYIPFLTLICADTLFVVFAAFYEYGRENFYGLNMIVPDIVVSIAYSVIAIRAVREYRKELRRSRE